MYDTRHGGPYDRGDADAYYGEKRRPHYFKGATNRSERIEAADMTVEELAAYEAGFTENHSGQKDYG